MYDAGQQSALFKPAQRLSEHLFGDVGDGALEFVEAACPPFFFKQNNTIVVQVSAITLRTCRAGY